MSNIPVAVALALLAFHVSGLSRVTVLNASGFEMRDLKFTGPNGKVEAFGDVPPGRKLERSFQFVGEGEVRYQVMLSGRPISGTLLGYISSSSSDAIMVVGEDGTLVVVDRGEAGLGAQSSETRRIYAPYPLGACAGAPQVHE